MLVPCLAVIAPGCLDHPVRMRAVQVAVLIDHLELDPEAEFQADLFHLPGQSLDA